MGEELKTKKYLGQHWLKDEASLKNIVDAANISKSDTVLEVGSGLGTLTGLLVKKARKVVALELDEVLAQRLSAQLVTHNLIVRHQDILKFDLGELPANYKVAANIPYYLTGNLLRLFADTSNPPKLMVLLVQKEVAKRITARVGQMGVLSVAVQLEYEVKPGNIIPAKLFTPPPQVDSQIVIFKKRKTPLFKNLDRDLYMRLVKAGFSGRRKKLRGSLSAGLAISKKQADKLLKSAKINGDLRAQNLSLQDWHRLYVIYANPLI